MPYADTADVLAWIDHQDTPIHSTDVAAAFNIDNLEALDLILSLHDQGRVQQVPPPPDNGAVLWVTR